MWEYRTPICIRGASTIISSLHNEQVKHVVSLHNNKGRQEYGEFLVEGKRFVQEALLRNAELIRIYYCSAKLDEDQEQTGSKSKYSIFRLVEQAIHKNIPVEEVSEVVIRKMSAAKEPQGIIAIARTFEHDWRDIVCREKDLILILDRIQDPGNMGTILRTALAAGVKNIILTHGTVDVFNPKVLRSSMGSVFSLKILADKTPAEITNYCKTNNYLLTVSAIEGTSIYEEKINAKNPLALIMGNEAFGISKLFLKEADRKICIPMFNNVESLNVAIAAGIFLFELRRQLDFL